MNKKNVINNLSIDYDNVVKLIKSKSNYDFISGISIATYASLGILQPYVLTKESIVPLMVLDTIGIGAVILTIASNYKANSISNDIEDIVKSLKKK